MARLCMVSVLALFIWYIGALWNTRAQTDTNHCRMWLKSYICLFSLSFPSHLAEFHAVFYISWYHCHWATLRAAVCPEESSQDGERSQEQDLGGAAYVHEFVPLGEEKADACPCHSLWLPRTAEKGVDLLPPVTGTWGDGAKLCQGMFRVPVRRLFTERVVGNCNGLSRERVMTPRSSEFKEYLHNAPNHTV